MKTKEEAKLSLVSGFPRDEQDQLDDVGRRLARNARGHLRQALRLKFVDDLATFLVISGGIAALTLSGILVSVAFYPHWIAIALVSVSALITTIGVLQSVWHPGARSFQHKGWGMKFAALENECKLLSCGLGCRKLPEIMDEMTIVGEGADLVPLEVWRSSKGHM